MLIGSLLCPLLTAVLRLLSSALPPVGLLRRNVSLSHMVRVPFAAPVAPTDQPLAVDLPVPTPPVPSPPYPPPIPSDYPRDLFPGPVGGRLCLFLPAWQSITQDPFILSVIAHGFRISVSPDFPRVLRNPTKTLWSPEAHLTVLEENSSLIIKQAIVQVSDSPALSLSPIFVIPKHSGGLRVILNLKAINVFIPPQHFRMRHLCRFFLPSLHRTGPSPWISRMHTSTFLFIRNRTDFSVFNTRIAPSIIRFSPLVFGIPPGFLPISLPRW